MFNKNTYFWIPRVLLLPASSPPSPATSLTIGMIHWARLLLDEAERHLRMRWGRRQPMEEALPPELVEPIILHLDAPSLANYARTERKYSAEPPAMAALDRVWRSMCYAHWRSPLSPATDPPYLIVRNWQTVANTMRVADIHAAAIDHWLSDSGGGGDGKADVLVAQRVMADFWSTVYAQCSAHVALFAVALTSVNVMPIPRAMPILEQWLALDPTPRLGSETVNKPLSPQTWIRPAIASAAPSSDTDGAESPLVSRNVALHLSTTHDEHDLSLLGRITDGQRSIWVPMSAWDRILVRVVMRTSDACSFNLHAEKRQDGSGLYDCFFPGADRPRPVLALSFDRVDARVHVIVDAHDGIVKSFEFHHDPHRVNLHAVDMSQLLDLWARHTVVSVDWIKNALVGLTKRTEVDSAAVF